MPRQRSSAYPAYTLDYCLIFVDQIYSNFGASLFASREQIAEALGASVGGIQRKIGSSVQYGLLELRSKEGYKTTNLFTSYKRPVPPNSEIDYIVQALKTPTIYAQIFEQFENNIIPSEKPMSNIFFQNYGVSEKSCEDAASVLFQNLNKYELLNEERVLILDKSTNEYLEEEYVEDVEDVYNESVGDHIPKMPLIKIPPKDHRDNSQENNKDDYKLSVGDKIPFNVPLKGRRTAQLLLPDDMSNTDFDTLLNWVRLMKESF